MSRPRGPLRRVVERIGEVRLRSGRLQVVERLECEADPPHLALGRRGEVNSNHNYQRYEYRVCRFCTDEGSSG